MAKANGEGNGSPRSISPCSAANSPVRGLPSISYSPPRTRQGATKLKDQVAARKPKRGRGTSGERGRKGKVAESPKLKSRKAKSSKTADRGGSKKTEPKKDDKLKNGKGAEKSQAEQEKAAKTSIPAASSKGCPKSEEARADTAVGELVAEDKKASIDEAVRKPTMAADEDSDSTDSTDSMSDSKVKAAVASVQAADGSAIAQTVAEPISEPCKKSEEIAAPAANAEVGDKTGDDKDKSDQESANGKADENPQPDDIQIRRMQSALLALRERRAELQNVNSELETSRADVTDLTETVKKIRSEGESLKAQLDKSQSEAAELRSKMSNKDTELSKLTSDLSDARGKLDSEEKAKMLVEADKKQLQADLQTSHSKCQELQKETATSSLNIQELKAELEKTTTARSDVEAALATAQLSASALRSQLDSLRSENEDMREAGASQVVLRNFRRELQDRMTGKWQETWGELLNTHGQRAGEANQGNVELPHRSCPASASVLKPRGTGLVKLRRHASFSPDSVKNAYVISYKSSHDDLWLKRPEISVSCDKCQNCVPSSEGTMQGDQKRSRFTHDQFLCAACVQASTPVAVVGKPVADPRIRPQTDAALPPVARLPAEPINAAPTSNQCARSQAESSSTSSDSSPMRSRTRKRSRSTDGKRAKRKDKGKVPKDSREPVDSKDGANKKAAKKGEHRRAHKEGKTPKEQKLAKQPKEERPPKDEKMGKDEKPSKDSKAAKDKSKKEKRKA